MAEMKTMQEALLPVFKREAALVVAMAAAQHNLASYILSGYMLSHEEAKTVQEAIQAIVGAVTDARADAKSMDLARRGRSDL